MYISTIGQDSHAYDLDYEGKETEIMIGGTAIPNDKPVLANSDGDVVLHAITNAISGYTMRNILGGVADELCLKQGIRDSRVYLEEGLKDLRDKGAKICHLSISIECKRPKLLPYIDDMRKSLGEILNISPSHVGITATTGEGLTAFGKAQGIQAFVILSLEIEPYA